MRCSLASPSGGQSLQDRVFTNVSFTLLHSLNREQNPERPRTLLVERRRQWRKLTIDSHSEKPATNQQRYAQFAPAKFRHFVNGGGAMVVGTGEEKKKKQRNDGFSANAQRQRTGRKGRTEENDGVPCTARRKEGETDPTRPAYSNRLPKFDPVH